MVMKQQLACLDSGACRVEENKFVLLRKAVFPYRLVMNS